MNSKKKRTIFGVVAGQVADVEQKHLLKGIISQARCLDIDIAVISNLYNPEQTRSEINCENKIYDIILSPELSGIILSAESLLNRELQTYVMELIKKSKLPTVVVFGQIEGFTCLCADDVADFEMMTDHLIEKHNITKIDMLTGPESIQASLSRAEGYKKSLEAHGIKFEESRLHFGNFWYESGEALAMKYINKELPMPEAVVCANDYMAYSLCDTLINHGIKIPEDISVVGYEYVDQRIYHQPLLTTFNKNRHGIGAEAVRILYEKIYNKKVEDTLNFKSEVIYGNSCACGPSHIHLNNEMKSAALTRHYIDMSIHSQFEHRLTECCSFFELVTVAQKFTYLIRNALGVYLCVYENWYHNNFEKTKEKNSDCMICYNIRDHIYTDNVPSIFQKNSPMPASLWSHETPLAFYCCPVFFQNKLFGYLIITYDEADGYDSIFRNWIKAFSNAMEFIRMKNDISYLLKCQNVPEKHDPLTGMYNINGLSYALEVAKSSSPEQFVFVMLRINMLSDNFTPTEQEKKLNSTVQAGNIIKSLIKNEKEFCCTIDQNTFLFIGYAGYDPGYEEILCDKLNFNIIHNTDIARTFGMDSFTVISHRTSDTSLSSEDITNLMNLKIEKITNEYIEKIKEKEYKNFSQIKTDIYTQPLYLFTTEALCRKFCFSEGYFRSLYKKFNNISFHQDCIISKITYAKYLLYTSAADNTSVASRCGYEDEKYFQRIFKKCTGLTPGQYRNIISSE